MIGSGEKNDPKDLTNQAEKGAVAEGFVQQNNQLKLFNCESLTLAKEKQQDQVWALLHHYDKELSEVLFELICRTTRVPIQLTGAN